MPIWLVNSSSIDVRYLIEQNLDSSVEKQGDILIKRETKLLRIVKRLRYIQASIAFLVVVSVFAI